MSDFFESLLIGIYLIPYILPLLMIPFRLIVKMRSGINTIIQKKTSQKIVTTSIAITLLWLVIIILSNIFNLQSYLIIDEILLCVGCLIIFTDNLMLKNDDEIIGDCSKLNSLKYKIEHYSLLDEKDVEQVILWEQYLAYAVAFGISSKIIKRMKVMDFDDELFKFYATSYYQVYGESFNNNVFARKQDRKKSFFVSTGRGYSSSGGVSRGSGGGFSGGGSFRGGGGRRRRRRSLLTKIKK